MFLHLSKRFSTFGLTSSSFPIGKPPIKCSLKKPQRTVFIEMGYFRWLKFWMPCFVLFLHNSFKDCTKSYRQLQLPSKTIFRSGFSFLFWESFSQYSITFPPSTLWSPWKTNISAFLILITNIAVFYSHKWLWR